MQFNSERFVEMDLNTATYHELITLLNIGEVGAASIVMARDSLKRNGRKLTLVDLTLDCGIPGDIVKEWMVSGEIQPVPRHEDSGENDQTAVLLVSIAASIQALSEAVDIVNDRQSLFESALNAAGLDVTGATAHVTNPIDKKESMSLSRQDSQHQQYRVEELTETQTTISHHDYVHQDEKPEQSCHQPSFSESDWSDDLDAALEEQLKLIRQFKLPGEEECMMHECRGGSNSRVIRHPELSRNSQELIMADECCCGGSNSRVIRHPEWSRSRQELIMVDECSCGGSNSRVMRHSELSQGAQHTEEPEKIYYKNSSTERSRENVVDAGLEQRLRLIRQSDRSEKEQSSNEVEEETSHVCRCGSIISRVMRHPELNEIGPGPRPIFRPGPNEAHSEEFSPSVGGPRSSRADWNRWSRIRVPEFKGNRSSWHSYLVQFNTIMKMNDCDDNEVKVCKLVEALRGKALDYFESLPEELRLEFESLCSMFEGRFGRQETPATMRSKLKCITQGVEETLAEFGERALKVTSEGYVGMTGQWVQALAVDAFLMGCLDKRSALSSMDKEPQTIDEAVKLMRRLGSHEGTLKTGKRLCTLEEEEDGASAPLQVHHMEAIDSSTFEINQLNESIKLLTELLTSTSQKLPLESLGSSGRRAKSFVCFTCGIQGHIARNCPRVSEESKRRKKM